MKTLSKIVFFLSFMVWLISSFVLPIFRVIDEPSTFNTLLVIATSYMVFFLIITSLMEMSNNKREGLNFKIGSIKKTKKNK